MRAATADAPRGATAEATSTGGTTGLAAAPVAGLVPYGTPPSEGSTEEDEPRGGGFGIVEAVDSAAKRLRGVSAQDLRLPRAANKRCEGVLQDSLAEIKWPHTERDIRHDLSNVGSAGDDDWRRLGMKLKARS